MRVPSPVAFSIRSAQTSTVRRGQRHHIYSSPPSTWAGLGRTHLPSPEEEFPLPSGNRPPASPAPLCELGLAIGYIWDSYLVSVVMVMF